jgi:hypothetical protein
MEGPVLVAHPDWVFTAEGKRRVDETLERQVRELEKLRAENVSLRTDLLTWERKPALTLAGALLLVGAGAVLGVGATIAVKALSR